MTYESADLGKHEDFSALQERYDFVSSILAAEPMENESVRAFRQLLNEDFVQWLGKLQLSGGGTDALRRLQAVLDQLELLVATPLFRSKSLIAVAGGFSSGKSSFITSLMSDSEVALPVGVEPVTSIPTYVMPGERSVIRGYTQRGGVVGIYPAMYGRLSHSFVRSFGFNLRDILPFVAIETQLRGLEHLAFIDLPGFGATDSRDAYTGDDTHTALEFLAQARGVIWVLGMDANGTVSKSDLDLLTETAHPELPLYVVVNKADLRPQSAIDAVLSQVVTTLKEYALTPVGVCAYSSISGQSFGYKGKALRSFLKSMDVPVDAQRDLCTAVTSVFRGLSEAMKRSSRQTAHGLAQIKQLEVDLTELGLFDEGIEHDDMLGFGGRRRRRRIETVKDSIWDALCALEEVIHASDLTDNMEFGKELAESFRVQIRGAF